MERLPLFLLPNDAAVQKGCGGGPIYDDNEAVVGVVVAQLNRLKIAKTIG